MTNPEKARENRLRRMAERQGLQLVKSRRRDPYAPDYGTFMVIDPLVSNVLVSDERMSLDDVETWLTTAPGER